MKEEKAGVQEVRRRGRRRRRKGNQKSRQHIISIIINNNYFSKDRLHHPHLHHNLPFPTFLHLH